MKPSGDPQPDRASGERISERVVHIVACDQGLRADFARAVFGIGLHAEVYSSFDELIAFGPDRGLLFYHDVGETDLSDVMTRLQAAEVGLPTVVASDAPGIDWAVLAVKAGAIDCLSLPASPDTFGKVIRRAAREAAFYCEARERLMEARRLIGLLTPREREVLDGLANGNSNKEIASDLEISPRTVEIHRWNMLHKLGARHSAAAIRMRLIADEPADGWTASA